MEMDYFKQKIYEISGVPKSSLEKIDEETLTWDEAKVECRFENLLNI